MFSHTGPRVMCLPWNQVETLSYLTETETSHRLKNRSTCCMLQFYPPTYLVSGAIVYQSPSIPYVKETSESAS